MRRRVSHRHPAGRRAGKSMLARRPGFAHRGKVTGQWVWAVSSRWSILKTVPPWVEERAAARTVTSAAWLEITSPLNVGQGTRSPARYREAVIQSKTYAVGDEAVARGALGDDPARVNAQRHSITQAVEQAPLPFTARPCTLVPVIDEEKCERLVHQTQHRLDQRLEGEASGRVDDGDQSLSVRDPN